MTTTSKPTPHELAERYFEAWLANDIDDLADATHDDITFHGPLAQLSGRADVLGGLKGLASVTEKIVIDKRMSSDTDVITWFTLDVEGSPGIQVANWCQVFDGRIAHIHVTFDPRPMFD